MADQSRREFVREAAAVGVGLAAAVYGTVLVGSGWDAGHRRVVTYRGAAVVGGPADRALPLIPAEILGDGTVAGRLDHPEWLYYCGMEQLPALGLDDADETIRYRESGHDEPAWFADRVGEPVRREHLVAKSERTGGFAGADGLWRGGRQEGVPVVVAYLGEAAPDDPAFVDGVGVFAAKCTHLCCLTDLNLAPSGILSAFMADDLLFCSCHNERWDPTSIVVDRYEPSWPETAEASTA